MKETCSFCKKLSDDCTLWYINNDRSTVWYSGVEESSLAKVYYCKESKCSIAFRRALNEVDCL